MPTYWTDREEQYVRLFVSGDSRMETRMYNKLHNKIGLMFDAICNRYFSINQRVILRNDTINHAFLQLKKHYNPNRQTAFAFLGFVVKNYLYDYLKPVTKNLKLKYNDSPISEDEMNNTISDDFNYIDDSITNTNCFNNPELEDELFKKIRLIRDRIDKKIKDDITYPFSKKVNKNTKKINLLKTLDVMEDFIKKYHNLYTYDFFEYLVNETGFNMCTASNYIYELFGLHISVNDTYRKDGRSDKYDYWNDDITPNQNISRYRHFKNKYGFYDYFSAEKKQAE